jgi:hypothetical protein
MKPLTLEKLVPIATFEELWASRKPDYKARNEVRTLKRHGIVARHERIDDKTYRVVAEANDKSQIEYLVLKRGFALATVKREKKAYSDVVQTILKRARNGTGGGIPLTRGEVAMLFLDGYAGDFNSPPAGGGVAEALRGRGGGSFDIRSQGYGEDNDWDGLTEDDVLEDENTAFVWKKWEPLELWL